MKILIADDDRVSRHLLAQTLKKWGYTVLIAENGAVAWEFLKPAGAPQLVILDWMMPELSGIELCRKIRRSKEGRAYTYVILLTSKDQKEDLIEGLKAGADDYLTKPFDPEELKFRLRAGQRILELEGKLLAAQERLKDQATHDMLTQLFNRRAIVESLEEEFHRSGPQQKALGICLIDLDHFKAVNDTYGHQAGDFVLQTVSERLLAALGPRDLLGRYGGEEFLVILPESDRERTEHLALRLKEAVSSAPILIPSACLTMTVSIGMALREEIYGEDVNRLIHAADIALYRAKEKGRNRIESAVPDDLKSQPLPSVQKRAQAASQKEA